MKSYVFITTEGTTFQPDSDFPGPDIENCQVIGFAEGNSPEEAFDNLIEKDFYLLETSFDEIICFELRHRDYSKFAKGFSLSDKREVSESREKPPGTF